MNNHVKYKLKAKGGYYIAEEGKSEAGKYHLDSREDWGKIFYDLEKAKNEAKWCADYFGRDIDVIEIQEEEHQKTHYTGPGPGTQYRELYPVSKKVVETVKATGSKPYDPDAFKFQPRPMSQIEKFRQRYRKASHKLDQISSALEERGMLREAYEIDIVSNTLESLN